MKYEKKNKKVLVFFSLIRTFVPMILEKLSLINYKNIPSATLELSPKINCLIGQNGVLLYHLPFVQDFQLLNELYHLIFLCFLLNYF